MNRILVFGENSYGQLRLDDTFNRYEKISEIKFNEKIKEIFVGRETTIIQTCKIIKFLFFKIKIII
jgi:hypothetical protein